MVTFSDRIGSPVHSLCMGVIDVGVTIKKGILIVGEEGSRAMYEVYGLEGFEKWSKALLADLRILSLIPVCKGVFDSCIKTLEAQRDLIYATLVFSSTAEFIRTTIDRETGETTYSFQLPRDREGNVEVVKVLYGIGNYFETAKFLQKYQVLEFPLCSYVAAKLGSIQLFTVRGQAWTFGDVPILNCWCNKPKDFFVFLAAAYTTYRCVRSPHPTSVENLLKLVGGIGKMILVTSAEYMLLKRYLLALSIVDVVTNNASLIAMFIKRHKERDDRFNYPLHRV